MTAPALSLIGAACLIAIVLTRRRQSPPVTSARAWGLVAVLVAHALALPVMGFVPASTGLFVVVARLFGSRRAARDAALGLAAAVLLYVIFTEGLGLTLPADPMTRWVRA